MKKILPLMVFTQLSCLGLAESNSPVYEYSCARCSTVWYKSVGGYARCPNPDCENNMGGRGSSGKKIE